MGTSRGTRITALLSDWPDALTEAVESEAFRSLESGARASSGERVWDAWRKRALAEGVSEELAALGRVVMREAIVRLWPEDVRAECGELDDGEAMIDFACADPQGAEQRWSELLEEGGRRVREPRK